MTLYVDGQPASWAAYFQVALEAFTDRIIGFAKGLHE
jgi:hypothetical protein